MSSASTLTGGDLSALSLQNEALLLQGSPLISGVDARFAIEPDAGGVGAFLIATEKPGRQRVTLKLGRIAGLDRFTSTFRTEPFWLEPQAGSDLSSVNSETQYLLARRTDGTHVLVVPLFSQNMRFALRGSADGLQLVGDTTDAFTVSEGGLALFVAVGRDPYRLVEQAARSVINRLGTGRLRVEKSLPAFVDLFGWCTWDAFYQTVSHDKVREGLESFARIGVQPRSLILDDGWQSERTTETGERRLTAFAANDKFPGGLAHTVRMAKEEFGIQTFIAWHAIMGYWGGVDGEAMPAYNVRSVPAHLMHYFSRSGPGFMDWSSRLVGVVDPERAGRFYSDYHSELAKQGVDGVKVDNQSSLEMVSEGSGGRVRMYTKFRTGLEQSVAKHFDNVMINCMANAQEVWYSSKTSNLQRSSTDFWPNIPTSHGLHLYTNAQVSLWFSQFIHPDWDMFQSGHAMGAFHAAGRAVSGAPVYVSDKPGQHNPQVLRKLVCSDGTVLRCLDIGVPTLDCLYHNATQEPVLLKIVNRNRHGWVVGVFNARYHAQESERAVLQGQVSPSDVPGVQGSEFVLYSHETGKARLAGLGDAMALHVPELTADVITIVPVVEGVAIIGLADKFNAGGAVSSVVQQGGAVRVSLRDGGRFVAWSQKQPTSLTAGGRAAAIEYDPQTKLLTANIDASGPVELVLEWR